MEAHSTLVTNSSQKIPVYVALKSPEDGHPPKNGVHIGPQSTEKLAAAGGTMNMFIWVGGDVVWQGIVPTKTRKDLVINPDHKPKPQVSYDGINLPEGFQPVTDPTRTEFFTMGNSKTKKGMYTILGVVALILLAIGIWWITHKK